MKKLFFLAVTALVIFTSCEDSTINNCTFGETYVSSYNEVVDIIHDKDNLYFVSFTTENEEVYHTRGSVPFKIGKSILLFDENELAYNRLVIKLEEVHGFDSVFNELVIDGVTYKLDYPDELY